MLGFCWMNDWTERQLIDKNIYSSLVRKDEGPHGFFFPQENMESDWF